MPSVLRGADGTAAASDAARAMGERDGMARMWHVGPPLQRIATIAAPLASPVPPAAPGTGGLMRHVLACNDAVLPGGRLALRLAGQPVGWVQPDLVPALVALGAVADAGGVALADAAALPGMAAALAQAGAYRWRGEAFDVRAHPDGPVLATADRGALPSLGIVAQGAHLNGIVRRADGPHLWVGRRSADKRLDPGKLDHLAAGGVPAGLSPWETMVKEAAEECGLPEALARQARAVAVLAYAAERPEGLRRDRLHCFDLDLPEGFVPEAVDGEVAGFELWPFARVLAALREGEDFKFNVALVLIDLFLREGVLQGGEAVALRAAVDAGTEGQGSALDPLGAAPPDLPSFGTESLR